MKALELTPENAWRKYWEEGLSFPECAKVFQKSVGTLKRRFDEWKFPTRPRGPRRGHAGPNAILTDDQIRHILDTVGELSVRTLAGPMGVSPQRISQIRRGQHRPLD